MTRHVEVIAEAFCSAANLGAGFDVFGLALNKYSDRVRVRATTGRAIRIIAKGRYGNGLPKGPKKNSAGTPAKASLLDAAIGAYEIWIWTDVDGLMTADPRIAKDAQVLSHVSFGEALELQLALLGQGYVERISDEKDTCIIAVVGSGMKGTPGVAARVFWAVAKKKVNIRMVAQGSYEYNISFAVSEKDGPEAVRAIHEEFKLNG